MVIQAAQRVNLVYAIFITILIYLTAKTVSGNYIVGLAAAFLYSCRNFAFSSAMYIRMYQQLVLMISWSCYWHVKNIGECNVKKSRYGLLCVITVLGTITHYHFLIFAFFEAVFYCISKWVCKHKRDVWKYFFSMGISAITSVLIFPPMIRDIFFGYRGTEAFSNLLHGDGYLNTANLVWNIIDNRLLAGIPIYIYVLMIISAIIIIVKQYGSDKKDKIIQLGMLFLPTMGFFLIVVRTAPYITDRYYFGIGAVIAVFIVCIVSIILQYLVKTRLHNAFLLSLCVVLPIVTLFKMNVNYLNAF